jgi:hypothetical protein
MIFSNTSIRLLPAAGFLFLIFLAGCDKSGGGDRDVIAYVNREPITESELKYDMALKARQDPSFRITPETEAEELDSIIDRKLLIQKAMEKGLAREPKFVNTIRNFWEQTLIRDLVDYKEKDYVYVTEDEIKNYYDELVEKGVTQPLDELRPEIKNRIAAVKGQKMFEDWLKAERQKAKIEVIKK